MPGAAEPVLLFDADGVLVDSHTGYREVWVRWSLRHGLDPVLVHEATHARRPIDTIAEVAPHLDPVEEYALLVSFVGDLPGAFRLFPTTAALLAELPPDRWAIVTSGDATTVRARLAAGGAPSPSVIVDGAAVARGKPDPQGYLGAAERLGADPASCLVVEDAPAGIEAGRAAGMSVLALTTSHAAESLADADLVLPSLRSARPVLLDWIAGRPLAG